MLYEGSRTSGQPRPEINETWRFIPVEHLLHLIYHPVCNRVRPWNPIQQVGHHYILRVFYLYLVRIILHLFSLLLPHLHCLLLWSQIYLLHFSMEGQFLLKPLKLQPWIHIIVNFFLIVPQPHKIGEMESNVPQLGLVVFVKYFLNIFHVLVRQVLFIDSHLRQLCQFVLLCYQVSWLLWSFFPFLPQLVKSVYVLVYFECSVLLFFLLGRCPLHRGWSFALAEILGLKVFLCKYVLFLLFYVLLLHLLLNFVLENIFVMPWSWSHLVLPHLSQLLLSKFNFLERRLLSHTLPFLSILPPRPHISEVKSNDSSYKPHLLL